MNAFDAEGRAVTLEGIGVTYDALGRAVEAAEPGGAIEFLYGPGGGKLAVMNGQTLLTADVPLPGGGSAVYHGAALAYYRHADWLGSSRLASTPSRTLYSATAYAPYGEHHEEAGTIDRNFTGQNQDIDSSHSGGQYDFLDREFNAIQGRWWTPDPAGLAAVDPNNPQSWNRYAYVNGRPLGSMDPLGLTAFADGCIPVASNDSGAGTSANAEANGDFGPYEPDEDGAASSDDGYSGCAGGGNGAVAFLDGAEVDGMLGDFTGGGGGGGGWGGGGSGSALQCPGNVCGGIATDGHTYVQFEPFDGGGAGYYNPNDLSSGINDYNGSIYNDAQWKQEGDYLAYGAGQWTAVVGAGSADGVRLKGPTSTAGLKGGNDNYLIYSTCSRCAANQNYRYGDDLHLECGSGSNFTCWVHMDTASPYIGQFSWGSLFTAATSRVLDTIQHVGIDVILGNIGGFPINRWP